MDAANDSILKTPLASQTTKEIFMDRLQKELLIPFRYSLSSQLKIVNGETVADVKARRSCLRQCIVCGINSVSQALHEAVQRHHSDTSTVGDEAQVLSSLCFVVLTSDVFPAGATTSQIPVLAKQLNVPILLLPGLQTSKELGSVMGAKSVAAMAFLPPRKKIENVDFNSVVADGDSSNRSTFGNPQREIHAAIDSFASFIVGKIKSL